MFVNCPFDEAYLPLLRPMLFTIIDIGLVPLIASDKTESGQPRVHRIIGLIERSKYAIHDLSRIAAESEGELFRLNMPFELGIDVGCRLFKSGRCARKVCLILEAERYRYQAALSDVSGSDIAVHGNTPARIVTEVRNWLNNQAGLRARGPAQIWGRFNDFMNDNYDALKVRGFSDEDIRALPTGELITCMQDWVRKNPR